MIRLLALHAARAVLVSALLIALTACQTAQPAPERFRAADARTLSLSVAPGAIPEITIMGGVGAVAISAGAPEGTLEVTITKIAYGISQKDAEAELDDVKIALEQDGARVQINTQQRQAEGQRPNAVDLHLTVPEAVALDVTVITGDIVVMGIVAEGLLRLHTYAGTLTAEEVRAPAGMALQSNAGNITFRGAIGSTGEYAIRASAGLITAQLPAGSRAQVDARALIGTVRVSGAELSDLQREQRGAGMTLSGALGTGGPTLTLEMQTGDIALVVGAPEA